MEPLIAHRAWCGCISALEGMYPTMYRAPRKRLLAGALLLGPIWLAACGGVSSPPAAGHSPQATTATQAQPTPPAPLAVAVAGPVRVVSNSVGGVGYEGAVVFRVRNPNADLAAVNVPYRVTVSDASGAVLYTSAGTDVFSVPPSTTRPVVSLLLGSGITARPTSASVTLYPSPTSYVPPAALPDLTKWRVSALRYQCGQSVECQLTGDLTWTGAGMQQSVSLDVVVHQGADASGPVIAAGATSPDGPSVTPGAPVPVTWVVSGFMQPQGFGYAAALPTDKLTTEVYVESANADDAGMPSSGDGSPPGGVAP